MSQAGDISAISGPVPPTVPTSFPTDNGTAVPLANVLIVLGKSSSENDVDGIITKGGVTGTGTQNEVDVVLTNRVTGTVQTIGLTTSTVLSFTPPNTEGGYSLTITVVGYISSDKVSASWDIYGTVTADGLGGFTTEGSPVRNMIGNVAFDVNEVTVSIGGGSILVTATGLTAKTIRWTGLLTYIFGGA
jgi:hypothetical protein